MASEVRRKLLATKTVKSGGDGGITLASLAAAAWRQFAKFDLGYASPFPMEMEVRILSKGTAAPTAGGTVDFYFGFSDSATAGTNNPANLSGADAAYNGYGAAGTDADECMGQMAGPASLVVSNDAAIQTSEWIGPFLVKDRYLVGAIRNSTSQAFTGTEGDHQVQIRLYTYESQ
jgi:hypothetical protein